MSPLDYARIEKAILFLEENFRRQPSLGELAAHVGLSEYHFQRLFRRWAGISPKRFLQYLTAEYARELLREPRSTLEVAYEAGLSGPGRLHDLLVSVEAMTPGEVKRSGAGLTIRYGIHPSPFGECLLALTGRGICTLAFLPPEGRDQGIAELRSRWEASELREDPAATLALLQRIFHPSPEGPRPMVNLHLKGTNFQLKVWEALLKIPAGHLTTYEEIAASLEMPGAARAVGNAVGQNPVAFLIPCHRVIRKTGAFGGYRWGAARKKALVGWEAARRHASSEGAEDGYSASPYSLILR